MKCQDDFLFRVISACVDWAAVVWGVPFIGSGGAGTASFVGNGGHSEVIANSPDGFLDTAAASCTGTVHYTGPACMSTVHLVMTKTGTDAFTCGAYQISSALHGVLLSFNAHVNPSGTYDLPFMIPDTGGVPDTISIFTSAQVPCLGADGIPCSMDVSATVTSV
jgi:hypothetical protein